MVTTRRRTSSSSVPAALGAIFGMGPAPAPADAVYQQHSSDEVSAPHATRPFARGHARRRSVTTLDGLSMAAAVADGGDDCDDDDDADDELVDISRNHRSPRRGGDSPVSTSGPVARAYRRAVGRSTVRTSYLGNAALPNLALLCLAVSALVLMLSVALHFGIVAGGLVGPAWSTFKSIEGRPGAAPVNRWAAFWIMSALVFATDRLFLASLLAPWLPGPAYSLMLFFSVVWLSRDNALNTERLYDKVARPLFIRYENTVDAALDGLADRVDDISRFGLIQVSNVVRPIAVQLEHAATVAKEQHDRIAEKRRHQTITN